jgi:hypothetical protein
MGDAAVCYTFAPTQVQVLQRSEATKVGNGDVCQPSAATQVKVLQRRGATQVGDASL